MIAEYETRFVLIALYVVLCTFCVLGTLQGVRSADAALAKDEKGVLRAALRCAIYFAVAFLAYWLGKQV